MLGSMSRDTASDPSGGAAPGRTPDAAGDHVVVIASLTRSLTNFRGRLLETMVRRGCRVTALAPDDEPDVEAALAALGVRFLRIPMNRTGMNPLEDLATLRAIWGLLRTLRPDMVLAYTMKPIIFGGIAARLARVPGRYAMITGLGHIFGEERPTLRGRLVRALCAWLYRRALRGAEAVFVYNEADAADVARHRMIRAPSKLTFLPGSGVDLDQFDWSPPPEGPVVFLLVARLLREKGIAEFAAAARAVRRRHPSAVFRLLGPYEPGRGALSPGEIAALTGDGVVDYLGFSADVRPHLRACSVFVLPSYYREGIPRSILEAMAIGRAIITTDLPGCRDPVSAGENGVLVPPRDPERLAEAMEHFLLKPALVAEMGRRSREIAGERFDVHYVNAVLLRALGLSEMERPPG
jgi:glycosyltransferase involved in cell wall biosynthesis